MIYIFEDHPEADISLLFKSAYNEKTIESFIYAKGNGNLIDKVNSCLLNTVDMIIVFMDTIPGNKDCYSIYKELSHISKKANNRVVVLPIICAEYYMIQSIQHTNLFIDTLEVERCINKIPHITSNLMKYTDKAKFCKNFEKYCKYILKYNTAKDCLKPYNKSSDVNGEYYKEACTCQVSTSDCLQTSLSEKAMNLLTCYKYVPSGSEAVDIIDLTEEGIWDIHRKLVDEYNAFADEYILVDSNSLNKYKKIGYIK